MNGTQNIMEIGGSEMKVTEGGGRGGDLVYEEIFVRGKMISPHSSV